MTARTPPPVGQPTPPSANYPTPPPAAGPLPFPPPRPPSRPGLSPVARTLIGLALLLPALLAWLWTYVLPTLSTVTMSFRRDDLLTQGESVGGKNYQQVFDDGLIGQFGFAILLGLLPLAFALLVAPLLALVADRAGWVARLVTRAVLVLPVAGYAPVALFLGWRFERNERPGALIDGRGGLAWVVAATSFGLVIAVAVTLYLAALRRRESTRRPIPALLTVGGLLILGVIAVALQNYNAPMLITGGGPDRTTSTPVVAAIMTGLSALQLGPSAATSTILLVVLGVLGLAALGLLLATRTRIEFDGWWGEPGAARPGTAARGGARPLFIGLVVVALVVFLGIVGWAVTPWLKAAFSGDTQLPEGISASTVLGNTWVPPLISAVVAIVCAALGGFGIGALRPLGRYSELLLVPFAPWLFVGIGPLAIAGFRRTQESEQINTFLGLIPPVWLSVPALFAFTLLFRGQYSRWRAGGGFGRTALMPALPMLAVTFLLTWFMQVQQPLWAYMVASEVDHMPASLINQVVIAQQFTTGAGVMSLILPMPILVLFVLLFAAMQVGYLDRLAIRVGAEDATDGRPSTENPPIGATQPGGTAGGMPAGGIPPQAVPPPVSKDA